MTQNRYPRVTVTTEDFCVSTELARLHGKDARIGAICSFIGVAKDFNEGLGVSVLELEHYPAMTERSIEAMVDQAFSRFEIFGARVIHRVGKLAPTDQIVLVAVTSAHRGTSFIACEFLMDCLKTQATFWKKEHTPAGSRWVNARASDDAALAKWGIDATNFAQAKSPVIDLDHSQFS